MMIYFFDLPKRHGFFRKVEGAYRQPVESSVNICARSCTVCSSNFEVAFSTYIKGQPRFR